MDTGNALGALDLPNRFCNGILGDPINQTELQSLLRIEFFSRHKHFQRASLSDEPW